MKPTRGQDSIGGLCRLAALLEDGIAAASAGQQGRLAELRGEADRVTRELMRGVFHDFMTPLGRGETGAAALALYDCILLLPDSVGRAGGRDGGHTGEMCAELGRAIRLCCSALRGRGRGDCGLDCYLGVIAQLRGGATGSPWQRTAVGMCRAYEALCAALLGSV